MTRSTWNIMEWRISMFGLFFENKVQCYEKFRLGKYCEKLFEERGANGERYISLLAIRSSSLFTSVPLGTE
ncbi:MAG: hypothetical protein NT175_00670 [Bacteroidetes bacterium]|nr:hypothetical protein [Bacteroidota bacterium]